MGQDGDAIHQRLDEASILADIAYFEDRLRELDEPRSDRGEAMERVYQALLAHRRRMLAAWRDGRPERWFEYDDVA